MHVLQVLFGVLMLHAWTGLGQVTQTVTDEYVKDILSSIQNIYEGLF